MLSVLTKISRAMSPSDRVLTGTEERIHEVQKLPSEVLLHVLTFCSRKFIVTNVELVNKKFHKLARSEYLWHCLIFEHRQLKRNADVRVFEGKAVSKYTGDNNEYLLLNGRDYYMENILVRKSCTALTNFLPPKGCERPSSPTIQKLKDFARKNSFSGSFVPDETRRLMLHDKVYEKKIAQQCSRGTGADMVTTMPHARHRHTITCTSQDQSRFVMIGGFRHANNTPVVTPTTPVANPFAQELDEREAIHMFDSTGAVFNQDKIVSVESSSAESTDLMDIDEDAESCQKPLQFGKHSCVKVDNKLYLFGGTEGMANIVTNSLYIYDLNTREWKKDVKKHKHKPSPRTNHQSAVVYSNGKREMYVVGGGIDQEMRPTDEIWALDIDRMEWRQVEVQPAKKDVETFTARLGFTMVEVNNKLVVYGGGYWEQTGPSEKKWREYYRDLFIFDVKESKWSKINVSHCIDEVPRSGTFPVCSIVGTHLYVMGGGVVWDVSADINVLNLVSMKWRRISSVSNYAADSSACITVKDYSEDGRVKTRLLVFGGYRYKPLSEMKVFGLQWADYMQERQKSSVVKVVKSAMC